MQASKAGNTPQDSHPQPRRQLGSSTQQTSQFELHDVSPKLQSGLSSINSEASSEFSSSLHDCSTYDETLRHDNRAHQDFTEQHDLSSNNDRDREHGCERDRPNEDRQVALKKASNRLEPELREKRYGSAVEQNDWTEIRAVGTQKKTHQLIPLKNDQNKTIDDLRSKLQIELANSQSIRESANKMAFAMENKDLFVGRQDSDDVVISRFSQLVGQIKTWSVPFAAQERIDIRTNLSGAMTQDPRRVVPGKSDLDGFLQNPKNARLFVRGWAGLNISEMFFRTLPSGQHHASQGKDVWMSQKIGRSFFRIEDELFHADRNTITFRDLNDWRALTAGLVSKLYASSNIGEGMKSHVSDCSRQIMSPIGSWVDLDVRKKLEEYLMGILLQAVELSQILRCQRASWSVRHVVDAKSPNPGLTTSDEPLYLNEDIMDDDSDDDARKPRDRKIVEIVISPGLFKRGNTDGERFEVESCVEKAKVKCFN